MTQLSTDSDTKLSILFVDDEEKTRKVFHRLYSDHFDIIVAEDPSEALQILESDQHEFAIVVSDQRMPNATGIDLLKHMAQHHPQVVRIMSTAYADYEVVVEAINLANVFAYVTKPWEVSSFELLLQRAVQYFHLGNKTDGLIHIPEPKIIESHRIDLDDGDLGDVVMMLNLLQKAAKSAQGNSRKSTKFTLINRNNELVIGVAVQGKPQQLVTLAHFREQFDRLGTDATEGDLIGSLMGTLGNSTAPALPAPLPTTLPAIVPTPSSASEPVVQPAPVYVSDSQRISIQSAADQLQLYFATFLNAARHRRITSADITRIEAVINGLRRLRESDRLVLEEAKRVRALVAGFLDDLNRGRNIFRAIVAGGKIPESTFTSVFIHYNIFARHFNGATIEPDQMLTALLRESMDKKNSTALWVAGSTLLTVPVLLALILTTDQESIGLDGMRVLKFFFVWLLSIISGVAGYRYFGRAEAAATFKLPGFEDSKLSVAGTGGVAIMILVFLVGIGCLLF